MRAFASNQQGVTADLLHVSDNIIIVYQSLIQGDFLPFPPPKKLTIMNAHKDLLCRSATTIIVSNFSFA